MIRARMFLIGLAALLAVSCDDPLLAQEVTQPAAQPEIAGEWNGTIDTQVGSITLVLYVAKDDAGALKAQVENAYQAPGQMAEVTSISVKDGHLSWKIDRIGATFEGDWNADKAQWLGTFHQGADMPLAFAKGQPAPFPIIAGIDGLWTGTAELNGAKLRQAMRINTGARGTIVLYDSPDQLVNAMVADKFTLDGQSVSFSLLKGLSTFAGSLSDDKAQLSGKLTNTANGQSVAVTFTRTQQTAERKPPGRPQTPKEPFPYKVEEVAFDNPAFAEVQLAGSLTLPEGAGPFPAAVMITGSGAQDRDEALVGHKPFAVIADYLTRHGIAVLRFDDRGFGKSTGDYASATSADLATDANAAAAFLKTRAEIRKDAIGFIGHSEGGMIGPIAAAGNPDIAYVVMLSGPGTHLDRLMLSQRRLILTTMGVNQADIDKQEPIMAAMFKAIAEAATVEAGKEAAKAVLTPDALKTLGVPADFNPDIIVSQVSGPWYSYFLRYDPAPNLAKIKAPILALGGSLDLQVPAGDNLAAIAEATKGNPDVTLVRLPGLNHLFQHATTGGVGEYATIEETFAPEALELVGNWINARFGKH